MMEAMRMFLVFYAAIGVGFIIGYATTAKQMWKAFLYSLVWPLGVGMLIGERVARSIAEEEAKQGTR